MQNKYRLKNLTNNCLLFKIKNYSILESYQCSRLLKAIVRFIAWQLKRSFRALINSFLKAIKILTKTVNL
jgi:hypothetical protein